jgi:hypothetical protein
VILGLARIVGLAIALVAIIFVRSNLVENIHPWQPLWMLWVGSTCLVSGCLGWVLRDVVQHRRGKS